MAAYAPSLPSYNDAKEIRDILKLVEIDQNETAIACIQIILQPFEKVVHRVGDAQGKGDKD